MISLGGSGAVDDLGWPRDGGGLGAADGTSYPTNFGWTLRHSQLDILTGSSFH